MQTANRKMHSNSFAARLTAVQRAELFDVLHAGLSYTAAAGKIHDWIAANVAAGLDVAQAGRRIPRTKDTTISKWYHGQVAQRRHEGMKATEIAALDRVDLAREKLEFEREKLAYQQRRDRVVDEAHALLKAAKRMEPARFQRMVDLALEEIQKMKRGEA
ncbi:MAG: hypothetical protein JSS11_05330 [Verrucomicrobia bacterium]|nr:hypothetical protein [Verrucomicrobiota bacterium]